MSDGTLTPVLRSLYRLVAGSDAPQTPDGALLERVARDRDPEAFAELVRRHGPMVWGVCRRVLRHGQAAEDAFQATFLVLTRKAHSVRRGGSLAGWLYRVALRLALAARTDLACRQPLPDEPLDQGTTDPAEVASRREALGVLDELIRGLPEKYRLPLLHCYLQGRSHAEAAAELNWPVGTVAGRLARAKELLHRQLTRRGVTLAAGPVATLLAAEALGGTRVAGVVQTFTAGTASATPGAVALADQALKPALPRRLLVGLSVVTLASLGALAAVAFRPQSPPPDTGGQQARLVPAPRPRFVPVLPTDPNSEDHGFVTRLALSGDGRSLLVGCRKGGVVAFWDLTTGKPSWQHYWGGWHHDADLALSRDGRVIVATRGWETENLASVLDLATGEEGRGMPVEHRFGDPTRFPRATCIALSGDGKLLATGGYVWPLNWDTGIILWDPRSGKQLRTLRHSEQKDPGERVKGAAEVSAVCLSDDGKTLASYSQSEGSVVVWDTADGTRRHTLPRPEGECVHSEHSAVEKEQLALSGDGRVVAVATARTVAVWDAGSGKRLRTITVGRAEGDATFCIALGGDGRLLAVGGRDGTGGVVTLWDTATGDRLHTLRPGSCAVDSLALSGDGRRLVTGTAVGYQVRVWDTVQGEELCALALVPCEDEDGYGWLAFCPDGSFAGSKSAWPHLHFREADTGRLLDDAATRERLHNPGRVAEVLGRGLGGEGER